MSSQATRIQLCGELIVEWDGERLEDRLPGRQGRMLFAHLALRDGLPVRRDELIDAIWGDGAARGESVLAPVLSRVRRAIGPERIEGREALRLVLPPGAWVDWRVVHGELDAARDAVHATAWDIAWERASAALEIAGRGLLPGLDALWIDERRGELEELRLEALETLAVAGASRGGGSLPHAQRAAREAVDASPFRESARVALIEVLRARGNVAEALRVYDDARVLLRDELGMPPGPQLMAMHEELLSAATPAAPRAAARAPAPVADDPELLERDRELRSAAGLLDEARSGSGRVLLIEGPAGIGKTRLLSELRRRAQAAGWLAVTARAAAFERELPFGIARQAFEALAADPELAPRAFAGAAEPALQAVGPASALDAGADASFAALHGLYWLTLNLAAEQPLLLAIDDVQWSDRGSLRFLAYLVRRLQGTPILIAATLRTGETETDPDIIADLASDPAATVLRPSPLSLRAAGELVRRRLGADADEAFAAACQEAAGGNPLLLEQLLAALADEHVAPEAANVARVEEIGAREVARTVLSRLRGLPPDATAVAEALAVLGDGAGLPVLSALAGVDETRVAVATGELARAEILRSEPPLGFVHALVRDAIYGDIAPGERQLRHARAARLLAAAGASDGDIAGHLLVAPRVGDAWVAQRLIDAGASAVRRGAPDSAVAYLRRALEEPPPPGTRGRVVLHLGLAEAFTDGPAAAGHLQSAYDELEDPEERGRAALALARMLLLTGGRFEGAALARRAAASLPDELADLRTGLEALELAAVYWGVPVPGAPQRFDAARATPVGAGPGGRMLAAVTAFDWASTGGPVDACVAMGLRALHDGVIFEYDEGFLPVTATLVLVIADRDEAMQVWDAALEQAHRTGSQIAALGIHLWRGLTLLRRGELTQAEVSLSAWRELAAAWRPGADQHWYGSAFLAATLLERGDLSGAREALDEPGEPDVVMDSVRFWLRAKADLLLAEGRHEEALLVSAEMLAKQDRSTNPAWHPVRSIRARALAGLGRHEEALDLLDEELLLAHAWGAPGTIGRTLRVRGELRGADGVEDLRDAVDLLGETPARYERARALAALGRALRDSGRGDDAVVALSDALRLAETCGAGRLIGELRVELGDAAGPARGVRALTDIERRVVDLAAAGATNRDIAQALFVAPSVVQEHLAGAYRKLGVGSKGELPRALAA